MKTKYKVKGIDYKGDIMNEVVVLDTPKLDTYDLDQFPSEHTIDFRDYCYDMNIVLNWEVIIPQPKKPKKKKRTLSAVELEIKKLKAETARLKNERADIEADIFKIEKETRKIQEETKIYKIEIEQLTKERLVPDIETEKAKKFGRYQKLRNCTIIGYIDYLGAVHSVRFNTIRGRGTHSDIWGKVQKGWDWDYNSGIDFSIYRHQFDKEDWDKIRRHLTKKYGVQWNENGSHDCDYIDKMVEKESKENGLDWKDMKK